jgi:hypothetical protein
MGPHCEGTLCTNKDGCDCECEGCSLDVLFRCCRNWANRAQNAQLALDLDKAPSRIAQVAGQMLDLSQDIERVIRNMKARFE